MIGSRAVVVAVGLALLPPQCAKLLGESKPAPSAQVDPPPPPPPPSITAPPVWRPPEPPVTDGAPTSKPEAPSDAARARAAIDAKEYKKARAILEKKVKSGGASPEEIQLLVEACTPLKDKSCLSIAKKAAAPPTE